MGCTRDTKKYILTVRGESHRDLIPLMFFKLKYYTALLATLKLSADDQFILLACFATNIKPMFSHASHHQVGDALYCFTAELVIVFSNCSERIQIFHMSVLSGIHVL